VEYLRACGAKLLGHLCYGFYNECKVCGLTGFHKAADEKQTPFEMIINNAFGIKKPEQRSDHEDVAKDSWMLASGTDLGKVLHRLWSGMRKIFRSSTLFKSRCSRCGAYEELNFNFRLSTAVWFLVILKAFISAQSFI
jgi:hypothetical protein